MQLEPVSSKVGAERRPIAPFPKPQIIDESNGEHVVRERTDFSPSTVAAVCAVVFLAIILGFVIVSFSN
ncbi:MAG: hypothetical protein M3M96_07475 [Candidatus Eremiobacteraeota bacterium]|nr:hypothetical protein [Candidatus Eremiobacteraeota bacterium]